MEKGVGVRFNEATRVNVSVMNAEVSVHYSGRSVALSTKRLLGLRGAEKKQHVLKTSGKISLKNVDTEK